jgi:hypothetical protein
MLNSISNWWLLCRPVINLVRRKILFDDVDVLVFEKADIEEGGRRSRLESTAPVHREVL